MTIADLTLAYLVALEATHPYTLGRRLAVRALIARDSDSRWWETES